MTPLPAHRCAAWLLCAGLAGLAGSAMAQVAAPEAAQTAPSPAKTAPQPQSAPPPVDPLEHLRQRLAERLSAQPPNVATGTQDLRLHNRPTPKSGSSGADSVPESGVAARRPSVAPVALKPPARAATRISAEASLAAPTVARPPRSTRARSAASSPASATAHWDYSGPAGPQTWGGLRPEFALCASGERQSPIDIRGGLAVELEPVHFDYRASPFSVIDNGHTIQANIAAGNSIQLGGRRFDLQQFHFHRPAEERIDGRQFEMSLHLLHKDEQGRLLVVTLLLDTGPAQPVVQQVWNNLPLEKHQDIAARQPLDVAGLLPVDRRYYTYMGSLTTPPCTEGVQWVVMREPVTVSAQQVALFERLYPMNARPLQQAAGRRILQSE